MVVALPAVQDKKRNQWKEVLGSREQGESVCDRPFPSIRKANAQLLKWPRVQPFEFGLRRLVIAQQPLMHI